MVKDTTQIGRPRLWLTIGGICCALYVALGAFGAHKLKEMLSPSNLNTYETGLRYLMIHGLGLIAVNTCFILLQKYNKWVNLLFAVGIILFSFGLVVYALQSLGDSQLPVFAMVAPIGGLSFVAGWLIFAFSIAKK